VINYSKCYDARVVNLLNLDLVFSQLDHRLILWVDNVDICLSLHGCELRLIDDHIWTLVEQNRTCIAKEK
jgi:tRNA U34 5-carboxymethylaminomethyl modifying enzyme MnmG/GidA